MSFILLICHSFCRRRKRSKGIYISLGKIKLLTWQTETPLRRQDNNTGRRGAHHLISLKGDVFVLSFHKHARDYSSVSASVGCSQGAGSGLGNYLTAFPEIGFLFSRVPGGGGDQRFTALSWGATRQNGEGYTVPMTTWQDEDLEALSCDVWDLNERTRVIIYNTYKSWAAIKTVHFNSWIYATGPAPSSIINIFMESNDAIKTRRKNSEGIHYIPSDF